MKRIALAFAASMLLWSITSAAQQKNQAFNGEIMDSACAKMGSHDAMMKSHPNIKTAKDCTLGCVKAGSQYVLYNSATKTVYQLDDQDQPERFAGQKVTVTGSLDAASNTIHIANIKAAS
jgi:type 1 fimbria pilin